MEVVPYTPALLPELAALANTHLVQVPPGWEFPEGVVAAVLARALDSWSVHYSTEKWVYRLETLCAIERGRLVAAAQWMFPEDPGETPGGEKQPHLLQWVFCVPGRQAALNALWEEWVNRASSTAPWRLSTGRFAFGAGWLGIPACWPHLQQGLLAAGFKAGARWIVYTGSGAHLRDDVPFPDLPFRTRLDWQERPKALEWELALRKEESGESIGVCQAWGIPVVFEPCLGYADWITVEWLGVEEPYRRLGAARWLAAEMIRRQRLRGVQHLILWTEVDNHPARRLYDSLGLQVQGEFQEFEWSND